MALFERISDRVADWLLGEKKDVSKGAAVPDPGKLPVTRPLLDFPLSTEFRYGINTELSPRSGSNYSFKALRNLADNCDLIRIAIQMRKEQMRGLRWDIVVKPEHKEQEKDLEDRRKKVKAFFSRPDPENDYNFNDFMSSWLEDLLVIDAAVVMVQKDRAGRLVGLVQIDGATIKPVIDDKGFTPRPPDPAYAQIINGSVAAQFTRDELLYSTYNPKTSSLFGMSPVEMCITAAHISLKRQLHNLSYYTEGSVPDYLLVAPPEWTPGQIVEVQRYLDVYLSGDSAKRRKMKLVPSGIQPKEMKQPDFSTQIDEWLARIIASVFNVAPHMLLKQKTKQQAGVIEDQQSDLGLDPMKNFTSEFFTDRVIRELFGEDRLAFVWLTDKTTTEEQNLRRTQAMLPLGVIGVDEVRRSEGKPELGVPPYIQLPNAIIFLTEAVRKRIASGEIEFMAGDGSGGALMQPVPKSAKPAAGPEPQSTAKKALELAMRDELSKWQRVVSADLKRGREIRKFEFHFLPGDIQEAISLPVSIEEAVRIGESMIAEA